ncbi:MAG: right-handed parallel beta-helix repeat-containing protein [Bacillota bacterium]
MPDVTTKLGLKKPLGNEVVSRAAYNENLDIIEMMAAREQFVIKSLSYDSSNNRIVVVLGPGIAELFNGDAKVLITKDVDTTYYITAPEINTTYYLYIQADGTIAHNTTGIIPAGAADLWNITTGAQVSTLTALDKRAILSAAGARLAAHLAETVLKTNKTINVPTDYPTIQAALDSLKYTWIPSDVTVTIQVAAGTYTHTSPIIINHPCGNQIQIVGATPVTTTCSAVGTITGSAGNWNVPITVASTSGIATGDYVIVKDTTGTGDHYAFRGIWKVISVDSATQITVQNTHRASTFPTATLSGGTVVALKTILKFTGCNGIVVAPNSALGFLDQVAVVGDGSVNTGILAGRVPSNQAVPGSAFIWLGGNVGVNGFGADGIWVGYGGTVFAGSSTASGNGQNGFLASDGSSIWAGSSTASGNGGSGFYAGNSGSISAGSSTASGNGQHGFLASDGSSIWAGSSTASGNGVNGFYAGNGGSISAGSSTATSNKDRGFHVSIGSSIYAANSTASGNTNSDYYAALESIIYVAGYTGTPTFSPAIDTVGNKNAIIAT